MLCYVSTNYLNFVIGNVLDKGRMLIIKSGDMYFITGISGTVTLEDCCAEVTIKWGTLFSVAVYECYLTILKHMDKEVFLFL